jgi:hypothetical protein
MRWTPLVPTNKDDSFSNGVDFEQPVKSKRMIARYDIPVFIGVGFRMGC